MGLDIQRDPNFQDGSYNPITSVSVDGLFVPALVLNVHKGGCITINGEVVTSKTKIPVPQAVYVTNKGIQLGMTIEDVLAKHGPPACSRSIETSSDRTTYFTYDGLSFTFYKGLVSGIDLNSYRPSDRPQDSPLPEGCR